MSTLTYVLLTFVGFGLCGDLMTFAIQNGSFASPEEGINKIKSEVQFLDEQLFKRCWLTEELTCNEVEGVLNMMKGDLKPALTFLMSDVEKHFWTASIWSKPKRCIYDIKDEIEEAIEEGVDHFSTCTVTSAPIQHLYLAEMLKKRDEYERSINNTLEHLDTCLQYSNLKSRGHKYECIKKILTDNKKHINIAFNTMNESKCMAHFTNNILSCFSEVFANMITKKRNLHEKIFNCVNYTYYNDVPEDYGKKINDIIYNYSNKYRNMFESYTKLVVESFQVINDFMMDEMASFERTVRHYPREILQPYYYTLNKALVENWSKAERECSNEGIRELDRLVDEGHKDYEECHTFAVKERGDGIQTLHSTLKDFGENIAYYSNVGLLKCIRQEPKQVFGSETIKSCADLAWETVTWEYELLNTNLSNILEKATQKQPLIMPSGKTCGSLRKKKLVLEAKRALDKSARCLYGESGDYYAVTTPRSFNYTQLSTFEPRLPSETPIRNWNHTSTDGSTPDYGTTPVDTDYDDYDDYDS